MHAADDPASPTPLRRRLGLWLHRWHRRCGVVAVAFLVWLALSGIALNESAALHLDSHAVDWPWLMRLYGLHAVAPTQGYHAGAHWLTVVDGAAVLDGRPLQPTVAAPLGLARAGGLLYVATADSLILLQDDGRRIDTLRQPPLPLATIRRIGEAGDRVAIQDLDAYASADGEDWSPLTSEPVQWSRPQALPAAVQAQLLPLAHPRLPLSRILADAHSGRVFGVYGVRVMEAVAVLTLVLAGSGAWMAMRSWRRQRRVGR